MPSITPFLTVKDGRKAIEFYTKGFGATLVAQHDNKGKINAELSIGNALFYIGDEELEFGNSSPETFGGSPVRIILTVEDPDAYYDRAIAAGATMICPVTTEEDWRIGKLKDPFGHVWEIGRPL
jgi:Uncharacterized protein conserved in bacteria